MKVKKEKSLYSMFLRYLIIFCALTIFLILSIIVIFDIAVKNDILKSPFDTGNKVEQLKKEVSEGMKLTEDKIPYPSKYVFYNNKDQITKTNFNKEELKLVKRYLNEEDFKSDSVYTKIQLDNGICVIRYDVKMHFTSRFWSELIPYPDIIIMITFLIVFILIAIVTAVKFGKRIKKELNPLKLSTERIINKDLDFEVLPSDIKEFNEVLMSMVDMKTALKKSLQQQWAVEQRKKEQISSLAHDIKTPITIIKGNAELLNEGEISIENKEYVNYIVNNVDKVEKYLSTLMEISKTEVQNPSLKENINTNDFIKELKNELDMLCRFKNINTLVKIGNIPKNFYANKELLTRGIINIMVNAVEYSTVNGEIEFLVNETLGRVIFTVKDCGEGFTKEGLINATNQFYMEKKERKVGKHYGIGLYIAESVAKQHEGFVVLKNREDKKGAEVSINIKI